VLWEEVKMLNTVRKNTKAAWLSVCMAALACSAGCFSGEQEVILFDFESEKQSFENADKLQYVAENATQGAKAGKITLSKPLDANILFFGDANQAGKWGNYDQFVIDVLVQDGPVKVYGWAKDDQTNDGWYTKFNYQLKLEPGKRQVILSTGAFRRENGKGNLDLKTLSFLAMRFESEDPKTPATIFLDNARLRKGSGNFEVKMLYSFEGQDEAKIMLEDWPENPPVKSTMTPVEEHASHGKKSLKLVSTVEAGNVQFFDFPSDWSKYDALAIDVFNPATDRQTVCGWVRPSDPKAGYWERHDWSRILKPGFNTIKLSLGGLNFPNSGKIIDIKNIVRFNIAVNKQTVFIDNVRLIKGIEEVPVAGMKKFDFGPESSAVMPGFEKVSSKNVHEADKGFGWLPGAQFGRDFDMLEMLGRHRPPDDLTRDFVMPLKGTFAVDVPDGKYGVWLMMGPPGNGWGPTFKRRSVIVNDTMVVDHTYDLEKFKAFEFAFQDFEDLPGDDLWEKYINPMFKAEKFEAEAKGGQLQIAFDSYSNPWSVMLNGLVLWPKASEDDAVRWLENLNAQRKELYQSMHVEKLPDVTGTYTATDADKAKGYVRFIHSPDDDVQVNSIPSAAEIGTVALDLAATAGEYEDGCIGIYPVKDCGVLKMMVSDLAGPNGASLPASTVKVKVQRYKAQNMTMVYKILPKYLDDLPAEGINIKAGITRSFWIVVKVPKDTVVGKYAGQIQLAFANGKSETVPFALTVYPFKTAEPDFPMGMFGMAPMQTYHHFDETGESRRAAMKEVIEDAREHGLTSMDPGIAIPCKRVVDGKAEVDFSGGDRFMETARAAGFTQELNGYAVSYGFPIGFRNGTDYEGAAKKLGAANYAELIKAYFNAVREHAREKNWLSIAICTDDEYIVHPGGEPAKLAAHHKLLRENAPGFRFVAYDSAYLGRDPKVDPELEKMFAATDTWGAGLHSPKEAEAIKKAGCRLWLYNTGMNRFTFGTYMSFAREKYDVKGFFQWVYSGGGTYNNFYLASHNEAHYGVVYPSTKGLRPTPAWERIRAGCDDHRYLDLASKLIKRSKTEGKAAAEAKDLETLIQGTFGKLHFGNMRADALDGQGKADNPFSSASMEKFRRGVAEGIIKLEAALK
jgi:hypothetical protein